jgi:threonine aldolase
VEEECRRSVSGPFPTPVGALSIECPVRRREGEVFDFATLKQIAAFARKNQIQIHLDGARLYLACAWHGIPPKEYAALCDTVYISLYKCFNAGSGAILAGSGEIIERLAHDRKLFGAGLYQAWSYAAVALHYLEGFLGRYQSAMQIARTFFATLEKHGQFTLEKSEQGTNVCKLRVKDIDAAQFQRNLAKQGYRVSRPSSTYPGVQLLINESLNGTEAEKLAKVFIDALGA